MGEQSNDIHRRDCNWRLISCKLLGERRRCGVDDFVNETLTRFS
jgi:hypothetical protein